MEENNTYGEYKEKQIKIPFLKTILLLLFVLIIFILLYILFFSKNNLELRFVESAKKYFVKYSSILPAEKGMCNQVTVDELIEKQLIDDPTKYGECDREKTKVKVCKLESGKIHYTPIINCKNKKTKFKGFTNGKETQIIEDKTDIEYLFMPEKYNNKKKNYYPNNIEKIEEVKEYYNKIPNEQYPFKSKKSTIAYKWYINEKGTTYWNNGNYSSTEPNGYPKRGEEGTPVTQISLDKPIDYDYREVKSTTLYRGQSKETAKTLNYVCADKFLNGSVYSKTKCEERKAETFLITIGILYSCDGIKQVPQNTICTTGTWTNWSTNICKETKNLKCEQTKGYLMTDKVWKWYVSGTYKKYYPSGSASKEEENTYYINSPLKGYIKDQSSKEKVFNYYKVTDEITKDGEWIQMTDNYLKEKEMYKFLNKAGYNIKSLKDINDNKEIKYKLKLKIRNRIKEK
ncbi:MAG: hypothetical protein RR500_01715 [Bacilli bacterium]